jgi:hypothetical protein
MFFYHFLLMLTIVEQLQALVQGQFLAVPPVNIVPNYRACPQTEEILDQIRRNITVTLNELFSSSVPECGDGLWYRVAYLNMTDPSQQCPPAWREYNTSGVRACGRPVTNGGSRPANFYTVDQEFIRVCSRAIGFQVGSPDGFFQFSARSLDQGYMDGVSITHGQPRQHIWSYVAGAFETTNRLSSCPCSIAQGSRPPGFIGNNNYYCESGSPINSYPSGQVFNSDPLWDGLQCEGTCCSGTKSPPWFSVQLPTHTIDRIEVRICADESTSNENVLIELLEIYVQ